MLTCLGSANLPGLMPCSSSNLFFFFFFNHACWLTTCTHSMRGSLTAMFPDKLTTQAGVSGVASSRAITASTPILLAWIISVTESERHSEKQTDFKDWKKKKIEQIKEVHLGITKILSKAEGVPPLCTWPRTVVRVSKPSFCDTSWKRAQFMINLPDMWLNHMISYAETLTCLTWSQVMGLPLRSIAPSATMIIFSREPRPLC